MLGSGSGGGGQAFDTCTNENSDGDGTDDKASCLGAATSAGTGNSEYRAISCEGVAAQGVFSGTYLAWDIASSGKWQGLSDSGPWWDCVDGSVIVANINGSGGGGATTLDGLTDTNIPTPTEGQVLTYDNASGKWVASAAGGLLASDFTSVYAQVVSTATGGAGTWSSKVFATCPANHSLVSWALTQNKQWHAGGAAHHYCRTAKEDNTRAYVQILDQSNNGNILCGVTAYCLSDSAGGGGGGGGGPETDPQVGAVTLNQWCRGDGSAVACDQAPPGGGTPSGAVMAFDLASCPTGWSPLAAAVGRVVVGVGTLGADTYNLNNTGGEARHTLTTGEMPSHSHDTRIKISGQGFGGGNSIFSQGGPGGQATSFVGSNAAHETRQPYLALLYCKKN